MDVNKLQVKREFKCHVNEVVENIGKLNDLKNCEEIIILANNDSVFETIKKVNNLSELKHVALFLSEKEKEVIVDSTLKSQNERLDDLLTKLEEV